MSLQCDSAVPACANCAKNDLECTSRDDALGKDIPRSVIKSLEDRIRDLKSQIAVYQTENARDSTSYPSNQLSNQWSQASHVWMPWTAQHLTIGLSAPSLLVHVTMEVVNAGPEASNTAYEQDEGMLPPSHSTMDRSLISPSVIRFLLARYDRSIKSRYPIPLPECNDEDGARLKKLAHPKLFHVLMACAIAAARESYLNPDWKVVAGICRTWAGELLVSIISNRDGETFQATLLLLIYEMAEPSRGVIWDLLDLAIRTFLQLGWHRKTQTLGEMQTTPRGTSHYQQDTDTESAQLVLIQVFKDIESSLRCIFDRPNMLTKVDLPNISKRDNFVKLYLQVSALLYGPDGIYQSQSCPCAGDIATLINQLDSSSDTDPFIDQTWLLFLPVCLKHKQCVWCFQELDDTEKKGMLTLRTRMTKAATALLAQVHAAARSKDGFISPLLACTQTMTAGCTLAVGVYKKWTSQTSHIKEFLICSEMLAMFAPHWRGGQAYLETWKLVVATVT